MRTNDEIIKTLENIESLLRSINYQLKKPLNISLSRGEELQNTIAESGTVKSKEKSPMNRLITTKEAAQITGLSEFELRVGAKQGRYPVLLIGNEDILTIEDCITDIKINSPAFISTMESILKPYYEKNIIQENRELVLTTIKESIEDEIEKIKEKIRNT